MSAEAEQALETLKREALAIAREYLEAMRRRAAK
jgi:hypothetical protein